MSTEQQHLGHGNSVAAWTAVGIMLIGALIGAVAVAVWSMPGLVVGVVVIVLGVIAWKVLDKMGYGAHRS